MAERFTISIDSNDRKSIWDDERTEEEPLIALNRFGEIWGIDDCCKLLNEQHEQIRELHMRYDAQRELYCQLDCVKNNLYRENEQLKHRIKKLQNELNNCEEDYILEEYL